MSNPLHARENQPVPNATMRVFADGQWHSVDAADHWRSGRHVVFALPGAFTPTCSSAHLPGFEANFTAFQEAGVASITCLSVNDQFVMEAWRQAQHVAQVTVAADGNGDFTRAMGMAVDKSDIGFGERSWRYAMVINDGVVEKQFIEPNEPGDPFKVSDADTVLDYLHGRSGAPSITLFSRAGCGHCTRARQALDAAGLSWVDVPVSSPRMLKALSPETTTPQVFVDGQRIGGADALISWLGSRQQAAA